MLNNLHPSSFHWVMQSDPDTIIKIEKSCEIINKMTQEQKDAIELYAKSKYEDGYGDGNSEDQNYN